MRRKTLTLVFHVNNCHLCASITSSELTVTADIVTVTAHPCLHISQYFTVKCCTAPTCVWEESPRLQYMLEQLAHEWVSVGQHERVGGGGTDKCWGQKLRQACPLEGRRSSWAECIYRAHFSGSDCAQTERLSHHDTLTHLLLEICAAGQPRSVHVSAYWAPLIKCCSKVQSWGACASNTCFIFFLSAFLLFYFFLPLSHYISEWNNKLFTSLYLCYSCGLINGYQQYDTLYS